jgi:multiple sugar transport system substrate-binding protein
MTPAAPVSRRAVLTLGLAATLSATAPARGADGVTLALPNPVDRAGQERLLQAFRRQSGLAVRTRYLATPEIAHRQYRAWLGARDSGVDVCVIDGVWTAELAAAGWLSPLDDRLDAGARGTYLPGPLAAGTWRGALYALPCSAESGVLYYRSDLVETPPTSWPDLVQIASRLTTPRLAGYVFPGKPSEGLVVSYLEILWAMGGQMLDAEGRVAVNSPHGVHALEFLAGLVRTSLVAPRGVLAYAERETLREFAAGRAVFLRSWSDAWPVIQAPGSAVRDRVALAPLPGPAVLGGHHVAISAWSERPDDAWRLARYLVSAEAQRLRAVAEGRVPARRDLFDDPEVRRANPQWARMDRALGQIRPRPASPVYQELSAILQRGLANALLGTAAPRDALDEAARQMELLLPA